MKMIERMARAIAAEQGDDFDKIPASKREWIDARGEFDGRGRDINEPFRTEYIGMALAALKVMREPSEEMAQAYYAACDEHGQCLWKHAHHAMIDAAIKEAEAE